MPRITREHKDDTSRVHEKYHEACVECRWFTQEQERIPTMKEELQENIDKTKREPLLLPLRKVRKKINREWLKQKLLDLYFASPQKIQFLLSRYVIKAIVNKKHSKLKDLIKH